MNGLKQLSQLNGLIQLLSNLKTLKNKRKRKRSCLVRQINRTRNLHGYFQVTFLPMKDVDPGQFFKHTRMTKTTFNMLLNLLRPHMEVSDRSLISLECRLTLTILYLAQGTSIQHLAWSWKLGKETVRLIVYGACEAIWSVLGPIYVTEPNTRDYQEIENDFWDMWNLPNCLGATDGKHIAIQCPPGMGSQFFNYKKYFSIVLMAACDAKNIFTNIDGGAYGSQSDGGIFNISELGKKFNKNELEIPAPKPLPGTNILLPHIFVGDAAFTLMPNLMKTYPGIGLSKPREIYNKRLSRARRVIENAFGILVSRWRILLTTLHMLPGNTEKVVLSNNFLRINKEISQTYVPHNYADWEDAEHSVQDGFWRSEISHALSPIAPSRSVHVLGGKIALQTREKLCYFLNNKGSLNWLN